jgi:hypothetical protein
MRGARDSTEIAGSERRTLWCSIPKEPAMYIVANHTISNPEKFWGLAKSTPIPPLLKLHCVFPSTDGAKGTCLWEAQSVDAVKQFVETLTSAFARNEYMIIESANAMGLPR